MPLEGKVKKYIESNALIAAGDTVIAAFSGGADSVCMLHILYKLSPIMNFSVVAAHLNHKIRGDEAERDESFAKTFCLSYSIPFYTKTTDVPAFAQSQGISMEDAGRRARYEYLNSLMISLSADKIATAHNESDNAETVLHHILRGSGTDGIQGILCRHGNIIRPILSISRVEIENYCNENSLSFVTDSTNLMRDYTRNKIRLDLIPYIQKEFNPNIISGLCRLSEIAAGDRNYLDSVTNLEAEKMVSYTKNSYSVSIEELLKLHPAIQKRMLLIMAKRYGLSIEHKHIIAVLAMIQQKKTGKSMNIPLGKAEIAYDRLIFKKNIKTTGFSYMIDSETDLFIPELSLRVKAYEYGEAKGVQLPINSKIELRNRKNGDKLRVNKMTKKISDLFINLKIPRDMRDKIPILTVDDVPVSIIGVMQGDLEYENNNNLFVLNITQEEHTNEK